MTVSLSPQEPPSRRGWPRAVSAWFATGGLLGTENRRRVAVFCGFVLLYSLTIPGNRWEAIDNYVYAYAAETNALNDANDTRSLLFHFINKLIVGLVRTVNPNVRGVDILTWQSIFAAAGTIVLLQIALRRIAGMAEEPAFAAGCLLGVLCGFWRYAVEAEVYAPSMLLILLALLAAFIARDGDIGKLVMAGALAACAALYSQANAFAVFFPAAALFGLQRWRNYAAFWVFGGTFLSLGIVAFFIVDRGMFPWPREVIDFVLGRFNEFDEQPPGKNLLLHGTWVNLTNIIAVDWLISIDAIAKAMQPFSVERLREILYLPRLGTMALLALGSMSVALSGIVLLIIFQRRGEKVDWLCNLTFLIVWLLILSIVIIALGPYGREPWLLILPPVAALSIASAARWREFPSRLVWTAISLLFAINLIGGMQLIASRNSYTRNILAPVKAVAKPGDVLLFLSHNRPLTAQFISAYEGMPTYVWNVARNDFRYALTLTPRFPLDWKTALPNDNLGRILVTASMFDDNILQSSGQNPSVAFALRLRNCAKPLDGTTAVFVLPHACVAAASPTTAAPSAP